MRNYRTVQTPRLRWPPVGRDENDSGHEDFELEFGPTEDDDDDGEDDD